MINRFHMPIYQIAATMAAQCTYWLVQNGVSLATLEWGLATIPPAFCVLAVHILFRNCFTVIWFSVKLLLAGLMYLHVQDLMDSSLRPLISIESLLSGENSNVHSTQVSKGFEIVRMHALVLSRSAVLAICPTCVPPLEPPLPPMQHDGAVGWVDYIADAMTF
jgi:hypothetical protein